ncbi:ABC transporter ATP-binding protein [bacterium]|nr:ABC transporter ATP-binding protein [bacterium]
MSNTPAPRTRQLNDAPTSLEGTSQASRDSVAQERLLAEKHLQERSRVAAGPQGAVVAQVTAVSKRFLGTLALNDVSLKLGAGEMFGLVGPNGAGKTTLLRILATLIPPDSGEVLVCGYGLNEIKKIRGVIGFMPDVLGVYDDMLVREYLDFFARASSLPATTRDYAVRETMQAVGIEHLAEQPVDGLSRGMKQRLCLGRSILHKPKLLLLDEPASGLDPLARLELREILRALQRQGTTIVISSHVLEDLADMCDRIGVVSRGQLICVDETKNLIEEQGTRRLRVKALGPGEELFQFLKSYPEIDGVRWDNDHILFRLGGQHHEDLHELLKVLIQKGFPIVSFYEEAPSLESAYMNVTRAGEGWEVAKS